MRFKYWIFQKKFNNKKCAPIMIFFDEKTFRNFRIIFDIKDWLWNSEIGIFWSLDLNWMFIWQKKDDQKVPTMFQSIKLPFDAELDEKLLNVI